MADKSPIEWVAGDDGSQGATWSTVRGCSWGSREECENCYAQAIAARFSGPGLPFEGVAKMTARGPRWTGKVKLLPESLEVPFRWRRPRRVFTNSMADTFHKKVPFEFIDKMFATMHRSFQHTFILLTKRADRMAEYFERVSQSAEIQGEICRSYHPGDKSEWTAHDWWPPKNVWWGTSVGHPDFKHRISSLRILREYSKSVVTFLSLEPLVADLGDLDLSGISWVIVGGESGHGARPMDLEWVRSIQEACRRAGTAFFCKQMGSAWSRSNGLKSKGGDMEKWPEDLRVRQFPEVTV